MGKTTVTVDFTKVVDESKPIERDVYAVQIKKFELKNADGGKIAPNSDGKWPYFLAVGEIIEGPYAGRRLFANLTTNPEESSNGNQKNFMLFNFLRILGLVDDPQSLSFDPDEVLNRQMAWKVDVEEGNDGQERNAVKAFMELQN